MVQGPECVFSHWQTHDHQTSFWIEHSLEKAIELIYKDRVPAWCYLELLKRWLGKESLIFPDRPVGRSSIFLAFTGLTCRCGVTNCVSVFMELSHRDFPLDFVDRRLLSWWHCVPLRLLKPVWTRALSGLISMDEIASSSMRQERNEPKGFLTGIAADLHIVWTSICTIGLTQKQKQKQNYKQTPFHWTMNQFLFTELWAKSFFHWTMTWGSHDEWPGVPIWGNGRGFASEIDSRF